jgi:nicotinamidase-related amidase
MHVDVIDPKKTAMILVDMQNDFVASGAAMETPAARQIAHVMSVGDMKTRISSRSATPAGAATH